jgi:hypothetical protein
MGLTIPGVRRAKVGDSDQAVTGVDRELDTNRAGMVEAGFRKKGTAPPTTVAGIISAPTPAPRPRRAQATSAVKLIAPHAHQNMSILYK